MKKSKKSILFEKPNIVEDYYNGSTHVKIMSNSFIEPEEVKKSLDRIAEIALNSYIKQQQSEAN